MFPLYTIAALRTWEQTARPTLPLMEQAGRAAAVLAGQLTGGNPHPVLILAGPGNNGGDALVLARHLRHAGQAVVVVLTGSPDRFPNDAKMAWEAWTAAGGACLTALPDGQFSLIVDGLFGIGLSRPPEERVAQLIEWINAQCAPVLSLDIPSGLCSDTGTAFSPCVRAQHTISFLGHKPGFFTADGPDHVGQLHLAALDTGIEAPLPSGSLLQEIDVATHFKPRRRNSHKGSFGSLGILGGSSGMAGAALLAGRAALHCGAGRVYLGMLEDRLPLDAQQPELMLRPAFALRGTALDAVVAGPGLGQSGTARELLAQCLQANHPLLLDADALNIVANSEATRALLSQRSAPLLLTPHPAEAARLLQCNTVAVQQDRIAAASTLAQQFNAHVVLKGAGSVIAHPDGTWCINPTGNPGLASAGTGDVLSGIIGSLLAQGLDAGAACEAGVYLHGAAADELVASGAGPIGLTASELLPAVRHIINRWSRLAEPQRSLCNS